MRVIIYDMDWVNHFSFIPNPNAQKISSFHKQKGDFVSFVEDSYHLEFDYDLMYVFREHKLTPMPESKYIDKKNIKLVGKEFFYYDNNYQIDQVIAMVRPDYMLYPESGRNAYTNAHMIQMVYNNKLLPTFQDFKNEKTKGEKKSYILDDIWRLNHKDLVTYLELIRTFKNIAFKMPISLARILTNQEIEELFVRLKFQMGTRLKFKNDLGSEYEDAVKIVNFLTRLQNLDVSISKQEFPIKAVTLDHWNNKENAFKDFERCLKIMDLAKERKVYLSIKTPFQRLTTPYWAFFDSLEQWTNDFRYDSYIEYMTLSTSVRYDEKLFWFDILNDRKKWFSPKLYFLLHLITTYPDMMFKYGTRRWGDEFIDINYLDFETIVKSRSRFEQKDILQKIEKELEVIE